MTDTSVAIELLDHADRRHAVSASGLLRTFNETGVIDSADVHVAQRLTAMVGESDQSVQLAVALVVRALRGGSVCVDVRLVAEQVGVPGLPWPQVNDWLAAVRASPLAGSPPVLRVYDDNLLYLDRYWREEQQVADDVLALVTARTPVKTPDIGRLFGPRYEIGRASCRERV